MITAKATPFSFSSLEDLLQPAAIRAIARQIAAERVNVNVDIINDEPQAARLDLNDIVERIAFNADDVIEYLDDVVTAFRDELIHQLKNTKVIIKSMNVQFDTQFVDVTGEAINGLQEVFVEASRG